MAPPSGQSRRAVAFPAKGSQLPAGGRVRRFNLLLADAALDLFDASEEDKARVQELKEQSLPKRAERPASEESKPKEDHLEEEPLTAEAAAEQRRKLEESRQRVRAKKEQREAEQKAAQVREVQIQRYFGRVGQETEAAEDAAATQPVGLGQDLPLIVLQDALSLQNDLLVGLNEPSIQRKLKHLQRSLAKTDPKGFASACQELILKVQSEVLPKYGFSGNFDGIQKMLQAFDHPSIHKNEEFLKNSTSLNQLLFGFSFTNSAKGGEERSLFEADDPDLADTNGKQQGMHAAGQARLAEEFRRQWGQDSCNEDNGCNGVGAYKSLASRFFGDASSQDPKASAAAARQHADTEFRLRREAALFMSIASRLAPDPEGEEDAQGRFDGVWEDGEGTAVVIEKGRMRGPNSTVMDFVVFDGTRCSLSMGNSVYEGRFSTDGRLLWKDGSMWVRRMAKDDQSTGVPLLVAAGGDGQAPDGGGAGAPATASHGRRGDAGGREGDDRGSGRPGNGGPGDDGPGSGGPGGGGPGGGGPGGGGPGGGGPGRGGPGGGGPGGGGPGGGGPGGGGPEDDPSRWYEDAPPGRIFRQTLPIFHPPDDGSTNLNRTVWRESGMPMIKFQIATSGERKQRQSCYSMAMAATYGRASPYSVMEAIREDIKRAVSDRNATRFEDAMETMEGLFPEEGSLRREINNVLGSLSAADKLAAKKFILEAMPYREKQLFEPGVEHYECQSVFQEPSWYADWEVQPQWMWPLPVLFAAHQSSIMLQPNYTQEPHKWGAWGQ